MIKNITAIVIAALLMLLPMPGSAIDIAKTTQTVCYDDIGTVIACAGTGQDGEIQAGVDWPVPRFTDNGDGTLTDNLTGLVWLQHAYCLGSPTWTDAPTVAATLADGNVDCNLTDGSVAGDWRVPNIVEFLSLFNHPLPASSDYSAWLVAQGFANIRTNNDYWTSTDSRQASYAAWSIFVRTGGPSNYKNKGNNYPLWPVRGGQTDGNPDPSYPANLWETGRPGSAGVAWPSPRFTDNGDGTITDNLTGIIWLQSADCLAPATWQASLQAASTLSDGSCGLADGSQAGDWRLPNNNELSTLVDYSRSYPAMQLGHPFTGLQNGVYWSSTSWNGTAADTVEFGLGKDYITDKDSSPQNILPVRDTPATPVPDITVTDSAAPTSDLSVPFGDVTELSFSDQTVTVINDGNADLSIGNIAVADALAVPFTLDADNCTGQTLTPAANCTLTIRFSPPSTGYFSDSFDIPSDDPNENPVTVNVDGTGIGLPVPDITVTDSIAPVNDLQVLFGNVSQTMSSDETVTITNDGNANLVIGNIAVLDGLLAPFSILNDNCSVQTVAPAASCTLTVRFAPTSTGAFTDSFDIPSDDADEASVTVNLAGTGTLEAMPDITVSDSVVPTNDLQVQFGNVSQVTFSDKTVTVSNDGNADLNVGNIAVVDILQPPFSILNDNCSGVIVAPASNCTLTVRFDPTAVGTFNDSFDIPSDDADESSVTVNLTGTGTSLTSVAPADDGDDDNFFGCSAGQNMRQERIDPMLLLMAITSCIYIGIRRKKIYR